MLPLFNDQERATPLLVVRLPGDPVGKGRPRSRIVKPKDNRPAFVHVYTDAQTREWEDNLRAAAIDAMAGRPILEGELEVVMFAYMRIPDSWPERRKAQARDGSLRPTSKPDLDNMLKALDAFNPYRDPRTKIKVPIVWRDDSQVVDSRVVKIYAQRQPGLIIEIRRAGPAPSPWAG
jgi:Holliday junction resolvase RusA-like endonuclease